MRLRFDLRVEAWAKMSFACWPSAGDLEDEEEEGDPAAEAPT